MIPGGLWMAGNKAVAQEAVIQNLSVVDLILIDHRYVKECIEVFLNDSADKREKLAKARSFLEALIQHTSAEKKAIYTPLESHEELHFNILEAEVEHGNILQKVKTLRNKLTRVKILRDELAAELKVLAEMVKHHLMEEESELLPKIKEVVDDQTLGDMGRHFMKLRKFTNDDLLNYPQLYDELIKWKDSIQKVSSKFLTKMDKFMEDLQH